MMCSYGLSPMIHVLTSIKVHLMKCTQVVSTTRVYCELQARSHNKTTTYHQKQQQLQYMSEKFTYEYTNTYTHIPRPFDCLAPFPARRLCNFACVSCRCRSCGSRRGRSDTGTTCRPGALRAGGSSAVAASSRCADTSDTSVPVETGDTC